MLDVYPEDAQLVNLEPHDPASWGSPPSWVIRALCTNTGTRLPKLEEFRKREYSGYGYGTSDYNDPNGYWPGQYCLTSGASYDSRINRRARKAMRRADKKKAARNEVPRGNLLEADYQFWRGAAYKEYLTSYCRWCERVFYNVGDRRKHFRLEGRCSHRIRAVQAFAAEQKNHLCFTCGLPTHKSRWGFPLCDAPACIGVWKFASPSQHKGWNFYKAAMPVTVEATT